MSVPKLGAVGEKTDLSPHKPQLTDVTVKLDDVPAAKVANG